MVPNAKLAFIGDLLLMRSSGDFHKELFGKSKKAHQLHDAKALYDSIGKQIFTLPDDYKLYPTHCFSDAKETHITVADEKVFLLFED